MPARARPVRPQGRRRAARPSAALCRPVRRGNRGVAGLYRPARRGPDRGRRARRPQPAPRRGQDAGCWVPIGTATSGGGSGCERRTRTTGSRGSTPTCYSRRCCSIPGRRDIARTAERAVAALDRYLDAVPKDGGCDEGINYWWRAGGSLFECLETLASPCGDDYGVFEIQKIRAIARYPVITHIADGWHVNFADGSPKPAATPHLLCRFGRRIGDQEVVRYARALRGDQAAANLLAGTSGSIPRPLSAIFDTSWSDEPLCAFPMPAQAWLAATGVLTARSRAGTVAGLFLAAKAGHNAESHNHNDIGSFIVALDGRPLLIDVGVSVYTRQTFVPQRYEIWTMQSSWHNVPEVDGVQQAAGREHAARRVQGLLGPGAAELTMDLAGAYPAEAGIRSWRRTIRLDRGGTGDGTILVEDAWEINHSPERIVVHLITAREPCPVCPAAWAWPLTTSAW